ncbi:MAG: ParB N-terminal domain-containing protein [Candidatus Bathyarchaeia archaeon]
MTIKNNNIPARIRLIDISELKFHELTDKERLKTLKEEILSDGVLKRPIVIDYATKVIIDGHHRAEALRLLGCRRIPACYVDYTCDKIGLKSNPENARITKSMVIEAALKNTPFKPKSTWHYIKLKKSVRHISCIQKRIDMPLKTLK